MGTLGSKKRELLLSPLISGTSLASRTVVACLLGSLLVALPSTINVANAASPTVTQLTIPSGLNSGVNDISVSDDGTKLVFVTGALNGNPYGGGVYQSLNSGATWTSTSTLPTDRDSVPSYVASTNTGQNVLIASYSSSVLYRSADYGATWTAKSLVSMRAQCGGNNLAFVNVSPSGEASGMDMSGDGTIIAASKPFSSCMLISRDSGANFSYITLPVSMGAVGAVYVSSSGNAIWYAKSETGGGLWKYNLSTNSWGSNLSSTVGLPRSITGSQDGTIIYAAGGDMQNNANFSIYKSTNSGATFTALASTSKNWLGLKASSDGTKLIGWDRSNNVWISQDSGVTWELQNNHPSSGIQSVKFSGDGSKAYMTTGNQYGSTSVTKVFQYAFPVASTTTIASQLQSVIYGATDTLTATIVVSGTTATNAAGTVSFYDNSILIPECNNITVSSGIATCPSTSLSAGEHTNITASYSGGGSISASISGASSTVSVAKAALSVIPTSISVAYGGTPSYLKTYSGFKNGQSSSSTSFTTGLTPPTCVAASFTTSTSVSASPLSITCSGGVSNNYTFTYTSTSDLTITKATPTLSIALNAATPTYGAVDTITATASTPGVVDFKISGATISGCGVVSTTILAPYTAQCSWIPGAATTSFTLTASLSPINSVDYNSANSSTTTTSNSNKATITVTPTAGQSKALGATDPVISYSITSGSLIGSDALSGGLTYSGSNVGTYPISIGTLANSNYIITLTSMNFAITPAVITYNTNGAVGTAPSSASYSGTAITLPLGTGLSKSGYNFGGWSLTEAGAAVTSPYSPTSSRTLYAVWTPRQYTITYNANGGTGSQSTGSYTTEAAATTLPTTSTFARTGYSFGGWAASAGSTTPVTSYSASADTVFHVIWTRGTFNVRFLANGGVGTMETQTSSATTNLSTNTFTFADRTFTGWNTSADGTGTAYSNSQSYPFLTNLALYARWGNLITYTSEGATSGSPSRASESWASGSINLPTVGTMVRAGYTFSGWNTGTQTYAGGASYTPTAGITLNPVWTANAYTISYNSNQATSGTVPSSQSWTTGTCTRTPPMTIRSTRWTAGLARGAGSSATAILANSCCGLPALKADLIR